MSTYWFAASYEKGQQSTCPWYYFSSITYVSSPRYYKAVEECFSSKKLKSLLTFFFIFQAAVICGCVGIIAEVSYEALKKRHDQGWVMEIIQDADKLVQRVREAKKNKEVIVRKNHLPFIGCSHVFFVPLEFCD
jgi:hypothetical protein